MMLLLLATMTRRQVLRSSDSEMLIAYMVSAELIICADHFPIIIAVTFKDQTVIQSGLDCGIAFMLFGVTVSSEN